MCHSCFHPLKTNDTSIPIINWVFEIKNNIQRKKPTSKNTFCSILRAFSNRDFQYRENHYHSRSWRHIYSKHSHTQSHTNEYKLQCSNSNVSMSNSQTHTPPHDYHTLFFGEQIDTLKLWLNTQKHTQKQSHSLHKFRYFPHQNVFSETIQMCRRMIKTTNN